MLDRIKFNYLSFVLASILIVSEASAENAHASELSTSNISSFGFIFSIFVMGFIWWKFYKLVRIITGKSAGSVFTTRLDDNGVNSSDNRTRFIPFSKNPPKDKNSFGFYFYKEPTQ